MQYEQVGFDSGFELGKRVCITDVRVPEFRGRVAENSVPHGAVTGG